MSDRVPYFTAAIRCLPGTHLLTTARTRMARFESNNPSLRNLKPPEVLISPEFRYAQEAIRRLR
jgi:hypothetical protein